MDSQNVTTRRDGTAQITIPSSSEQAVMNEEPEKMSASESAPLSVSESAGEENRQAGNGGCNAGIIWFALIALTLPLLRSLDRLFYGS